MAKFTLKMYYDCAFTHHRFFLNSPKNRKMWCPTWLTAASVGKSQTQIFPLDGALCPWLPPPPSLRHSGRRWHTELWDNSGLPQSASASGRIVPSQWVASHSEGCLECTDSALGDMTSAHKQTKSSRTDLEVKRWSHFFRKKKGDGECLYLHRYIVLFSFLKYSRGINLTHVQYEMYGDLQELTQDVGNHWRARNNRKLASDG